MKRIPLLVLLLLGLGSTAAVAVDTTTPLVINDTIKLLVSGTTPGSLSGQVTLQANSDHSVTYTVATGQFTDATGKPATLPADLRRVLVSTTRQALQQAATQARTNAYSDNGPAVLAALLKIIIALDPTNAAGYTNTALSGLLGPKTGLTDKGNAIALVSATATNAISESSLSPEMRAASLASVEKLTATINAKVSDPATDVAPLD